MLIILPPELWFLMIEHECFVDKKQAVVAIINHADGKTKGPTWQFHKLVLQYLYPPGYTE